MLRNIISEKIVKERHSCNIEIQRVDRLDNLLNLETKIACNVVVSIPSEDEEYAKDVENLLKRIIYTVDDDIIDIYKRN